MVFFKYSPGGLLEMLESQISIWSKGEMNLELGSVEVSL